ncbi:hypothetical protein SAMN04488530_101105 [Asaccharospora irregularis DSM 2635]|uniref:Uncharacterized protein n=1 Tax=Asaccharospora irregularis DSM 2635 TaxID=1121321 RepID=A0A1M5JEI1_9FIRM|nr:hypothetical protein SAMN04488530_101105 [Asaccharospora irregularis DSM 2635]
MKLNLDNIIFILLYLAFFLSAVGCLVCFLKNKFSHKIEFFKKIFLNLFRYSEIRHPKQYFSYLKYDIWRYCSLF